MEKLLLLIMQHHGGESPVRLIASTNTIVPDAFMTVNVLGGDNDPTGINSQISKRTGNIFIGNTGDIWIFS